MIPKLPKAWLIYLLRSFLWNDTKCIVALSGTCQDMHEKLRLYDRLVKRFLRLKRSVHVRFRTHTFQLCVTNFHGFRYRFPHDVPDFSLTIEMQPAERGFVIFTIPRLPFNNSQSCGNSSLRRVIFYHKFTILKRISFMTQTCAGRNAEYR